MVGRREEEEMTAGDLCKANVVIARADWSVVEAARRMVEYNVGDLVIIDGDGDDTMYPIGMLTDRDLVVEVLAESGADWNDLTIGEVMTCEVVTGQPDEDLSLIIARMRNNSIRRLPIVNQRGALIGILCFDDIVAWMGEQLTGLGSVVRAAKSRVD
jgi:CBS domain-containing protein